MKKLNENLSTHEREQTREIVDCLRGDLHNPPRWLDARLREMIGDSSPSSVIRPFVAFGLSSAAFLAVVLGFASALAETPMAQSGPGIAVSVCIGYLAISAAAALPLLIEHRLRCGDGKVHA